jgi:hypothetical protein
MGRGLALVLVLVLAVSSLMMAKPELALAQITKPSVPGFTVKLVDNSYDVPTTHSIDPYTGQNITHTGYHVENKTIEVTIRNQPFAPSYAGNSFNASFYYNVRTKGHYEENWTVVYIPDDVYPTQSNSDYTVLSFSSTENGYFMAASQEAGLYAPSGGQVDFQVEAMIGYQSRIYNPNATNPLEMYPWCFTGGESGWSNTQTITSAENVSPSPTSTPTVPEFPPVIVLTILLIALTLAISVFKRKTRNNST